MALVDRLTFGGIEVAQLNVVPHLRDQGVRVAMCSQGGPGELDREYESHGCVIHRLAKSTNPYATAREFSTLLQEARPDVVHSHKGFGSGAFALAASGLRIPTVVSFHSAHSNVRRDWEDRILLKWVRRTWLSWNRRQLRRHARVFIGHSETNLESLDPGWREDPNRYRVIFNGFEFPEPVPDRTRARRDLAIGDGELVLLHVGSFRPEKDHTSLLGIARRVFDHRGGGQLVMVGEGGLRTDVEQRVSDLGMYGHVRFAGGRRHLWPYYAAADVLVFPSMTEGFGNSLVEAQGVELPVVATDLPAHRESVAPDQHEFLFRRGRLDLAADLVERQIEAACCGDNPWVEESRRFVSRRFSASMAADALAALYREVVEVR